MILLHGFPYDVHTYVDVTSLLAAQGCRVIVPYLRGFGATRFRNAATPRSGEQAAIGADVLALMDALGIRRAVLAGHNWGGRAACVAAALWPERCTGLVTVNSYLIQDLSRAPCCRSARNTKPRSGTNIIFSSNAGVPGCRPTGARSQGCCGSSGRQSGISMTPPSSASAAAHDNPDYVDVVIHSYRHRFGLAAGDPRYADVQQRLAALPPISVPSVTLDGDRDGVLPASDESVSASQFTGRRIHRVVPGAGHNLPQEAPEAFAAAVVEMVRG